jgi:hypothetical protein
MLHVGAKAMEEADETHEEAHHNGAGPAARRAGTLGGH